MIERGKLDTYRRGAGGTLRSWRRVWTGIGKYQHARLRRHRGQRHDRRLHRREQHGAERQCDCARHRPIIGRRRMSPTRCSTRPWNYMTATARFSPPTTTGKAISKPRSKRPASRQTDDAESAIVLLLAPGAYTAIEAGRTVQPASAWWKFITCTERCLVEVGVHLLCIPGRCVKF